VVERHYSPGNDLYQAMLGQHMQYSCAYWRDAETLDQAQANTLHLICRKLGLKPGMRLLDVGGGFGSLARCAAKEYGCEVVAYNISHEQAAYARGLCQGLPVRIEEKDYRSVVHEPQQFDRIVSVRFFEHVGYKNYRAFLGFVRSCLKDGGLFLLHTIGVNNSRTVGDAWMDKYIFPGGMLPSMAQLIACTEGRWIVEDWHNFGPDYDRTMMAWWQNFERGWPELRSRYGDRFYRMWRYYLLSHAAGFRVRTFQLWQVVLSKGDIEGYTSVR
jgi:cyclopropane-fatty-acyl-phospholipid synthase